MRQILALGKLKMNHSAVLRHALSHSATDIFFHCEENSYEISMRRMGILELITHVPRDKGTLFCNRIKSLASMDLAERRRPADGRRPVS